MSTSRTGPGIVSRMVLGALMVASLLLLAVLAWHTFKASAAAVSGPIPEHPENIWARTLLVVLIATAATYWYPRRGKFTGAGLVVGVCTALVVAVLGFATYRPCMEGETAPFAPVGWILGMFTGDYPFEGPGSVCAHAFSPGFELARSLAVVVTASGAVGVVWLLARHWLDRWRVDLSGDVDVVVGLSARTFPLVQALVDQNGKHRGRPDWVDTRPGWLARRPDGVEQSAGYWWWWLTGLRPGDLQKALKLPPTTVIIEADPSNPLIAEARRIGALVVIGDAADPELVRAVVSRPRAWMPRRTALRRFYAVSDEQHRNLEVWESVCRVMSCPRLERHLEDLVPRIFVLMDDAREARQWRLSQIQHLGATPTSNAGSGQDPPMLVSDSITLDGIASELVVDRILPQTQWLAEHSIVPHVVLAGEGSLALTILDELAWQLWCRFEVAHAADRGAEAARPKLARVTLCGPKASVRKKEWDDLRAPWAFPDAPKAALRLFTVSAEDGDEEDVAANVLAREPDSVAVFVDDRQEYAAAASRLARRFLGAHEGQPRAMLRCDTGAPAEPVVKGGLLRFVPTLVRSDAKGLALPPYDSMTRLARQQHTVYRASHGWPGGATSARMPKQCSRLTDVPWEDLPKFFEEDNVRQHWQVLSWFTQHAHTWQPITAQDTANRSPVRDWETHLGEVARGEYARWSDLRLSHGWWSSPVDGRHDTSRIHPDLRGWEAIDLDFNERLIIAILNRMWATGLVPTLDDSGTPSPVPPPP